MQPAYIYEAFPKHFPNRLSELPSTQLEPRVAVLVRMVL